MGGEEGEGGYKELTKFLPCFDLGHSSRGGCHRSGSPWPPSRVWRTEVPSLLPAESHRM